MRHIGFDESTVLGEYARIAHEKGIIKNAIPAVPSVPHIQGMPKKQEEVVKMVTDDLDAFKNSLFSQIENAKIKAEASTLTNKYINEIKKLWPVSSKPSDIGIGSFPISSADKGPPMTNEQMVEFIQNKIAQLKGELESVTSADKSFLMLIKPQLTKLNEIGDRVGFLTGFLSADKVQKADDIVNETNEQNALDTSWLNNKNPNVLVDAVKAFNNWFAELMQHYNSDKAKVDSVYQPKVKQVFNHLRTMFPQPQYKQQIDGTETQTSNIGYSTEKQASKKEVDLYNTCKETGEDLVDSAHPGNTKTELDSKTKENLVETICEQQKRDLEVARSVPKGTYAVLINLHNKLCKMGHETLLAPLKKDILSVASTEDVVIETLIGLADRLDTMGYTKLADQVDVIVKSAGMFEWWANYNQLEMLWDRLEDIDKSNEPPLSNWIVALKQMQQQLKNIPIGRTEEEAKAIEIERAKYVQQVVAQLEQLKIVYNTMKQRGEIVEWGGDDVEFENQLGQTIKSLQQGAALSQQEAQKPVEPASAGEARKDKDDKAISSKTEEKPVSNKTVLNDYGMAMGFAKRFNGILIKVDPQSKVTGIHTMSIATGDPIARRKQQVVGDFRKSILAALKEWKAGGGRKTFENYLRNKFKDELEKAYPSKTPAFEPAKPGAAATVAGAQEQARTKLFDEAKAAIEKETGTSIEPMIANLINKVIRSGSYFFDLTDETGYEKVKSTLTKRLIQEGYLRPGQTIGD